MNPIFIFVLFLVVGGTLAFFGYLRNQQRRQELADLAARLGWQFDAAKEYDFDRQYPSFEQFSRGHPRYALNTLRGQLAVGQGNWPVVMGDYYYQITSGCGKHRHTQTHQFSYLMLELPFPCPGELVIRREGMFDKLAAMLGFDDIDFESAEFSRSFSVKGGDKKFAFDIIHPRMMEFLLSREPPTIHLADRHCCLGEDNRRWSAEEFQAKLAWAEEFLAQWPQYLLEDLASRATSQTP
jgi:hypothetical protein